jgi:hypothetical protein
MPRVSLNVSPMCVPCVSLNVSRVSLCDPCEPQLTRVFPDVFRVCPDVFRVCPDVLRASPHAPVHVPMSPVYDPMWALCVIPEFSPWYSRVPAGAVPVHRG